MRSLALVRWPSPTCAPSKIATKPKWLQSWTAAPRSADQLAERMSCLSFDRVERMVQKCHIDAAIVCTPPVTHPEICIHLAQSKIHVLCEKPFSIDEFSACRMLEAAQKSGVKLTMASKFRYVEDVVRAKSMVASGILGDLILFENCFASPVDMTRRWNSRPEISGGGVLIDNGTHSVDLMRYFLGPLAEVHVLEGKRSQGLDVEETVIAFRSQRQRRDLQHRPFLEHQQEPGQLSGDLWFARCNIGRLEAVSLSGFRQREMGGIRKRLRQDPGISQPDREFLACHSRRRTAVNHRRRRTCVSQHDGVGLRGATPESLDACNLASSSFQYLEAQSLRRSPFMALHSISISEAVRIHSTAIVEEDVKIGAGTAIWDNVHIRRGTVLGEQCIVGEKTYIAPGVHIGNRVKINAFVYICTAVTIEDGVMISAGVIFTNDRYPRATTPDLRELRTSEPDEHTLPTLVREGATIGAGSTIGCDLVIGRFAMVGMGSVVTKSVPDFALVIGAPARRVGYVCRCGEPLLRFDDRRA